MNFGPNWHFDLIQGSDEWKLYRAGKVTASMTSDVFAEGTGKSRENALADIVQEILTGKPVESFSNKHTQRGQENEPFGRIAYERFVDDEVQTVGFVDHRTIDRYGASPDGFRIEAGKLGGLELKNRTAAIHLEVLKGKPIPKRDMDQMIAQIDCCEFEFVDYGSYNLDFPGKMGLVVRRVWRDAKIEEEIVKRRVKIKLFIEEALEEVENLRRKYG